jgi:hypothetical protein
MLLETVDGGFDEREGERKEDGELLKGNNLKGIV